MKWANMYTDLILNSYNCPCPGKINRGVIGSGERKEIEKASEYVFERELEMDEWKVDRSYLLASSIYGLSQSREPGLFHWLCEWAMQGGTALMCVL